MESIPPADVLLPPLEDNDGELDGKVMMVDRSVRELWWYEVADDDPERCELTTTDDGMMLFEAADVKLLRLFKLLLFRFVLPTTTFSRDSVRRGEEYMSLWKWKLTQNESIITKSYLKTLELPRKHVRSCKAAFAFSTLCFSCSNVDWWKRYEAQSVVHPVPRPRQSSALTCGNGDPERLRSNAVW